MSYDAVDVFFVVGNLLMAEWHIRVPMNGSWTYALAHIVCAVVILMTAA